MKIAVITGINIPSLYAHSFNVMKMANGFHSLGNSVEVLTADSLRVRINRYRIKDVTKHYGVNVNMQVSYFKPSFRNYISGNTNSDPIFCDRVMKYIQRQKYDFVYCRNYVIPYMAARAGIPTFMETHTTAYDNVHLKRIYEVAKEDAFKGIVTIHDKIKSEHIKRGVPENKILVLEDGVDMERFEIEDDPVIWKKRLGLYAGKKYAVYCGHLYEDKGIEIILQSAAELSSNRRIQFLLVGGFEKDRRYWERYCKSRGICNVMFTGFISNEIIPQYLKAADCLLLPYKRNMKYQKMDIHTTSPLKLFEYMAAKRPIVATNIPTVSKILKDGINSILVNTDSIKDFSTAILKAIFQEESKVLGDNAYRDVMQYTWKERCKAILRLFQGQKV